MYMGSVMDEYKAYDASTLRGRFFQEKVARSMELSAEYTRQVNLLEGDEENARIASWVTPGVALVVNKNTAMGMEEVPCSIVVTDVGLITQPTGIGFRKNSDLVEVFNYQLTKMKQSGLIDKLRIKVWE